MNIDVIHEGELLAKVVRHSTRDKGLNFYTNPNNALQFAILNRQGGHHIQPHAHKDIPRTIHKSQEVLYLESGSVEVMIYSNSGELVQTIELWPRDTIILIDGGHGFHFLQESTLIYVKQGPYFGREEDKALL